MRALLNQSPSLNETESEIWAFLDRFWQFTTHEFRVFVYLYLVEFSLD